jgi:hypothetical protein
VKLYAHPRPSLPPLQAVYRFGSPATKEWFVSAGWDEVWGFGRKEPKPARAYSKAYLKSCPISDPKVYAALGGWHAPWPDGDWEVLVDLPLVVWTLADAEPWLEVFNSGRRFKVIQRVT